MTTSQVCSRKIFFLHNNIRTQAIGLFYHCLRKKDWHYFPYYIYNKHNYNALYDTGTGASLINYSAYVSLGQDLDTGYQPFMKNASGEDMGVLGQVTCTFTINPFATAVNVYMTNPRYCRYFVHLTVLFQSHSCTYMVILTIFPSNIRYPKSM